MPVASTAAAAQWTTTGSLANWRSAPGVTWQAEDAWQLDDGSDGGGGGELTATENAELGACASHEAAAAASAAAPQRPPAEPPPPPEPPPQEQPRGRRRARSPAPATATPAPQPEDAPQQRLPRFKRRELQRKRMRERRFRGQPADVGAVDLAARLGAQQEGDAAEARALLEGSPVLHTAVVAALAVAYSARHASPDALASWQRLAAAAPSVGVALHEVEAFAALAPGNHEHVGATSTAPLLDTATGELRAPALQHVELRGMDAAFAHREARDAANHDVLVACALDGAPAEYSGPPLRYVGGPHGSARREPDAMVKQIDAEVAKGRYVCVSALYRVLQDLPRFCARAGFVAKKGSSKLRSVQNYSAPLDCPNQHSTQERFAPIELASIAQFAARWRQLKQEQPEERLLAAVIDFSEAYRSVLLAAEALWLHGVFDFVRDDIYFDLALPFGSSVAPAVMCSFGNLVTRAHATRGFWSRIFVDDSVLLEREDVAQASYECLLRLSRECGFTVNEAKCIQPASVVQWLGFVLDVDNGTVCAAPDKVKRARMELHAVVTRRSLSLRQIQSTAGLLAHLTRVVLPGRPFLRVFFRTIARALASGAKRSHHVRVTPGLRHAASRWLFFLRVYNGTTLMERLETAPDVTLYTDAATGFGMGFYSPELNVYGVHEWSGAERATLNTINPMELAAIDVALRAVAPRLPRGARVHVYTDSNVCTAVLFANRARTDVMSAQLVSITEVCVAHGISLSVSHLSSQSNAVADALSRGDAPLDALRRHAEVPQQHRRAETAVPPPEDAVDVLPRGETDVVEHLQLLQHAEDALTEEQLHSNEEDEAQDAKRIEQTQTRRRGRRRPSRTPPRQRWTSGSRATRPARRPETAASRSSTAQRSSTAS
jgi:hypothetical protein